MVSWSAACGPLGGEWRVGLLSLARDCSSRMKDAHNSAIGRVRDVDADRERGRAGDVFGSDWGDFGNAGADVEHCTAVQGWDPGSHARPSHGATAGPVFMLPQLWSRVGTCPKVAPATPRERLNLQVLEHGLSIDRIESNSGRLPPPRNLFGCAPDRSGRSQEST
jgi:hypothetical protein